MNTIKTEFTVHSRFEGQPPVQQGDPDRHGGATWWIATQIG